MKRFWTCLEYHTMWTSNEALLGLFEYYHSCSLLWFRYNFFNVLLLQRARKIATECQSL
jgi:hypothetical protein